MVHVAAAVAVAAAVVAAAVVVAAEPSSAVAEPSFVVAVVVVGVGSSSPAAEGLPVKAWALNCCQSLSLDYFLLVHYFWSRLISFNAYILNLVTRLTIIILGGGDGQVEPCDANLVKSERDRSAHHNNTALMK